MLLKMKGIWSGQTVVYGPIWPFICKILSGLSMGNLGLALFIYKLFNFALHIANTLLVYKITNKKTMLALMYGLNPLALFDGIANVHNEIFVIFFILLALYFFVKKKNMFLTVVFIALATTIKYFAILLIPFIVLYYYQKENPINKIIYSCGWGVIFIGLVAVCYCLYIKDFYIFKGILVQQNKFVNSIFIFVAINNINLASNISKGFMLAYIILYITTIIKLIMKKEQQLFKKYMRAI